jgi:hypothetical protein
MLSRVLFTRLPPDCANFTRPDRAGTVIDKLVLKLPREPADGFLGVNPFGANNWKLSRFQNPAF